MLKIRVISGFPELGVRYILVCWFSNEFCLWIKRKGRIQGMWAESSCPFKPSFDHFAEVRPVENQNISTPKVKTFPKGLKRDFRGLPIIVSDQGGLEPVEPSSSHVGKLYLSVKSICFYHNALVYLIIFYMCCSNPRDWRVAGLFLTCRNVGTSLCLLEKFEVRRKVGAQTFPYACAQKTCKNLSKS